MQTALLLGVLAPSFSHLVAALLFLCSLLLSAPSRHVGFPLGVPFPLFGVTESAHRERIGAGIRAARRAVFGPGPS